MSATQPTIQPLSRERHKGMGWRRFTNHGFAAGTTFAPLADAELGRAALHLPLAFLQQNGRWQLVALLGLMPGQNLFVGQDGRWLGGYVPAFLRSYPFRIGRAENSQDAVFCIDEGSGLITESGGETFFNEDGQLSQAASNVWSFMLEVAKGEARLSAGCDRLAEAGVIEPWPLSVREGDSTRQVEGLHRVGEGRLNGLSDEAFLAVRHAGTLSVAYAQLFSTGHLDKLVELSDARAHAAEAARRNEQKQQTPGVGFGQNIDIDWSKVGL